MESFLTSHHTKLWCWVEFQTIVGTQRLMIMSEDLNTSYTDRQHKQNTLRVPISTFAAEFAQPLACIKLYRRMQKTHWLEMNAISTILDTKIPSKFHVTTQNMVLVIWQKINTFGTKVIELCYFLSYQNKKLDHNITMWLYSKLH